jgi:cytochrome c-type biogenesis protein CcmH
VSTLWLILGLLGILITALLMQARRTRLNMQRAAFDLQVFRDQLREVDRDHQRGMLNDEQAVAATAESLSQPMPKDCTRSLTVR